MGSETMKSADGTFVFRATKPGAVPTRRTVRRDGTWAKMERRFNPGRLNKRSLRAALCELGPAECGNCGLCQYGMEYLRRKGKR